MDKTTLAQLRLASLGLLSAAPDAGGVVDHLLALQGQDYPGVLWSVGLRLRQTTETQVRQALTTHRLVRSWPLRGTLHLCRGTDLRWLLALGAERTISGSAKRWRDLALTAADFASSQHVLRQCLAGGAAVGRTDLLAQLEAAGQSLAENRGYHLLVQAALSGLICQGPDLDGEQLFVWLDEWIPPATAQKLDAEAALARLVRQYFASHGPATLKDLSGWTSLPLGLLRRGLDQVEPALDSFNFEGEQYWHSRGLAITAEPADQVSLLPGFDEFLLGYKNRSAVLDPAFAPAICPGGNGVFRPTLVCGGQVCGTWKKQLRRGQLVIDVSALQALTGRQRDQLAQHARQVGDFYERPIEVNLESPSNSESIRLV